jgi:MoaA/NifB/PqqE/SkfB family radical SAM enzyme
MDELGVPKASQELRVAGVLFTYRCSIRCRHCLFGCPAEVYA